jgi:hypothetical protein
MMEATWKFDQPPNCAVFTIRDVLYRAEPVLHVTHDEDDHGWQFLCANAPRESDARIVALEKMLNLDPTLHELADLPVGWHAWRRYVGDQWSRGQNRHNDRQ